MFAPAVLAPYLPPGQHASVLPLPPYAAPGIGASPITSVVAVVPRTGPYVPAACGIGAAGNVAVAESTVAVEEAVAVATFTADAPDMAPWETVSPEIVMQEPSPNPSVVSPLVAASAAPHETEQTAAAVASPGTLPWIDAFLRSTPSMPMRAVEAQVEAAVDTADVADVVMCAEAEETAWVEASTSSEPVDAVVAANATDAMDATDEAAEDAGAFEVGAALGAPLAEANLTEVLGSATVDLEPDADDLVSPAWMSQASEQPASHQPVAAQPSVDAVEGTVSEIVAEVPESLDIPEAVDIPGPVDVPVSVDAAEATTELWPLADAAAAFRDLSVCLDQRPAPGQELAPAASVSAESALAPWADDDFMDVMPLSVSAVAPEGGEMKVLSGIAASTAIATGAGTGVKGQGEHVAVADLALFAHEPNDVYGGATVPDSANVAVVLEQLARRMRAGELSVPSYDARLGEQAALVAALAAVLGVRSF